MMIIFIASRISVIGLDGYYGYMLQVVKLFFINFCIKPIFSHYLLHVNNYCRFIRTARCCYTYFTNHVNIDYMSMG